MTKIPAVVFTALLLSSSSHAAQSITASLAQMPVHAPNAAEGVQVALVKAIARAANADIAYGVFPFARSISNVVSGHADLHIPFIWSNAIPDSRIKFIYSKETIFHVNFVLYTRKGSGVTTSNLAQHVIATDRAHVGFFPFPILDSGSIASSLKMLSIGRIDGYIFADTSTDPILRSLRLTNIQRSLYQRFDVKIIYPRSERGRQVAEIVSRALEKLKASGELAQIEKPVDHPYDNWQP